MAHLTNKQYYPYLLNREQASSFLGVDPKTFDKTIRNNDNLKRFMIGKTERFTIEALTEFISGNSI